MKQIGGGVENAEHATDSRNIAMQRTYRERRDIGGCITRNACRSSARPADLFFNLA